MRPRLLGPEPEPLGVLLLPTKLEDFELAGHARDLLEIPRVVAVEPPRFRGPRVLTADVAAAGQARRLRFPGKPRVFVVYDPRQYRLGRALSVHHQAELWYARGSALPAPQTEQEGADLTMFDELAREHATEMLAVSNADDPREDNQPLRRRLVELDIISTRPFVPESHGRR